MSEKQFEKLFYISAIRQHLFACVIDTYLIVILFTKIVPRLMEK
ncbi:Uncharacterized protein dnm_044680 [Desulfonema magnum]|uniref:Uncharacterized protein n=1 Tax=Desulfonema magnum TaxID=45655 RepID=A0A975GP35_9BACT|nr:Uncharacterized protein dnm_044680 [Desulfonema magnum]